MNLRLLFSVLLLVAGASNLQAQQKGFVVLTSGDTLRGQVFTQQKLSNPTQLEFVDTTGVKSTYYPAQLKGFGLATGERFESLLVPRNISPPATASMQSGRNYESPVPLLETEQLFLRVVLTGPASLLQHTDDQSRQNFYVRKGQEVQHLAFHQYFARNLGAVANVRQYIIQLRGLLADCADIKVTDFLEYNSKELSALLRQYAACSGSTAQTPDRLRAQSRLGLTIGAQTELLKTNAVSYPRAYGAGLVLLTNFPNRNFRWSAATELVYRSYQLKNTKAVMLSFIPRYRIPNTAMFLNTGIMAGKGWTPETSGGGLYGYLIGGGGVIIGQPAKTPVYLDLRITYGAEILLPAAFGLGISVAVPLF